jgi:hypothetical protein
MLRAGIEREHCGAQNAQHSAGDAGSDDPQQNGHGSYSEIQGREL